MRKERLSRMGMKKSERQFRSRLNQMIANSGLLRGTLTLRKVTCGKKCCRCAEGEPHLALVLTASAKGKALQLFIPKSLEGTTRRWIRQYRQAENILEKISLEHWDKLKKRKV
ncbi:MAG: hypothetical protein DDT34_02312 [Firmicutes bacterium]|nr:hypothetical protein [Bacillota bacterium]MBT9166511.1 hypothetical protein [Chloroflexota bacterium]